MGVILLKLLLLSLSYALCDHFYFSSAAKIISFFLGKRLLPTLDGGYGSCEHFCLQQSWHTSYWCMCGSPSLWLPWLFRENLAFSC